MTEFLSYNHNQNGGEKMPSQANGLSLSWLIALTAVAFALGMSYTNTAQAHFNSAIRAASHLLTAERSMPSSALLLPPSSWASMLDVPPGSMANATTIFVPPGYNIDELKERPFHVYHADFLPIIGGQPALSLIADAGTNPLFHEAAVWYPPTDEMFFVQNAGHPAAGTGLHKSSIIQKVDMSEAARHAQSSKPEGDVTVHVVDSNPTILNPNGGTNYRGDMIFAGEGMGEKASALYLMNPRPPYNTSVIINNYFGRQFNSLNDVAVNRRSGHIYFTDTLYGYLQDFRPPPVLPNQVYRLNPESLAITVVADGFDLCNGITFSPDGRYGYVTDTGILRGFYGENHAKPATIYQYEVAEDGTFENRKVFAHVSSGVADGIHCDSKGNLYAGCGDGVHVWNPSGTLLGKIFTGETVANFQFAGSGRMILLAEEHLYYATLGAVGAPLT